MAEAVVEETPPQWFYCHICKVKFESASENGTCPHCSSSFIEELKSNADNPEGTTGIIDSDDENEMLNYGPFDFLSTFQNETRDRSSRYAFYPTRTTRVLTRTAFTHLRQDPHFGNFIQEFMENLGVSVNRGEEGNMQILLGNPAEGLNAAAEQVNQMHTEPLPLPHDVIETLPVVQVTEDQVSGKLNCSVCWEDFCLNEKVQQLPCQHVYHEQCIRPWLELRSTCPVCRLNLSDCDQ